MSEWHDTPRIPLQISGGVVIASVQTDLTEDVLDRFRQEVLTYVQQNAAFGLIVDLSGIDLMDGTEFAELRRLLEMAALLGARPMLAGLSAGIIVSLLDSGANIDGIDGALHVDDALRRLREANSAISDTVESNENSLPSFPGEPDAG